MGKDLGHDSAPTLTGFLPRFPAVALRMPGRSFSSPVTAYEFRPPGGGWNGQDVDLDELLNGPSERSIVLRGFFQKAAYYEPYLPRIRAWYRFDPVPTPHVVSDEDVVVNVRGGLDVSIMGWRVAPSYYRRAVESMAPRGRVYVCGLCIGADVRAALADFDPVYYDGDPQQHFSFLMRFARIALTNSTFSWWAGLLSRASELYAPSAGWGPGTDLRMRERPYIELAAETEILRPYVAEGAPLPTEADRLPAEDRSFLEWLSAPQGVLGFPELLARYSAAVGPDPALESRFLEAVTRAVSFGLLRFRPEAETEIATYPD